MEGLVEVGEGREGAKEMMIQLHVDDIAQDNPMDVLREDLQYGDMQQLLGLLKLAGHDIRWQES